MPRFPAHESIAPLIQGWPIKAVTKYVFADSIGTVLEVDVLVDRIHIVATAPVVHIEPDQMCVISEIRERVSTHVDAEWELDYFMCNTRANINNNVHSDTIVVGLKRVRPLNEA